MLDVAWPPGTDSPDAKRLIEFGRVLAAASVNYAVIVVGPDERVLFASGTPFDDAGPSVVGKTLRELGRCVPALDGLRPRWGDALLGAAQEFELRASDRCLALQVRMTPLRLTVTPGFAAVAVFHEVTDRALAFAELTRERERIGAAERCIGFGLWELELETGQFELSDGARHLLGSSHADRSLSEVLGRPDQPCEFSITASDGTVRRVISHVARHEATAGHSVMSGTMIDITQLRASERARRQVQNLLRQAFDGSPIGMAMTDPHTGSYLQVNDALCALLGRSRNELLGLPVRDVTHPDDVAGDEAARRAVLDGGQANFVIEKRYIRADGEIVWGAVHVVPAFGDDGQIRGFLSQVMDLTDHKQREQQLVREVQELERLAAIQSAIASGRLVLHAQPIIALDTSEVVQQELLVRLQQEDGTLLPPGEFLPIAEAHGCIRDIDLWVTERAIEIASTGQPVEVNLSAASVGDERLLERIQATLAQTGTDPSLIVFEVTETAVVADLQRAREFASALHELGCRFALDDFGTGYGTLTYLKHFPIDYVKIDVEFVRDLSTNNADHELVGAIVTMAKGLGKRTVAEGVEDAETLAHLRALGVDQAQGYFVGRPAAIERQPTDRA